MQTCGHEWRLEARVAVRRLGGRHQQMAGVEHWGDTVLALFRMVRKGSITVAIVGTVALISPARAQGLATKRVAPEITSAGYSIAAEERDHAGHVRHNRSQQSS